MGIPSVILCGGLSRRMGRPKAWLPFGTELLLPRVVRILSAVTSPLIVVAAADQALPPLPSDIVVVRDEVAERGPLQGIAGGLAALVGKAEAAFITSCDVPLLRPAFVRRMIELAGQHAICVPYIDGFPHPLAGVYRVEVLPIVREMLGENQLRAMDLFTRVPTRLVTADELRDVDPDLESLRNVNTPEDYERALGGTP